MRVGAALPWLVLGGAGVCWVGCDSIFGIGAPIDDFGGSSTASSSSGHGGTTGTGASSTGGHGGGTSSGSSSGNGTGGGIASSSSSGESSSSGCSCPAPPACYTGQGTCTGDAGHCIYQQSTRGSGCTASTGQTGACDGAGSCETCPPCPMSPDSCIENTCTDPLVGCVQTQVPGCTPGSSSSSTAGSSSSGSSSSSGGSASSSSTTSSSSSGGCIPKLCAEMMGTCDMGTCVPNGTRLQGQECAASAECSSAASCCCMTTTPAACQRTVDCLGGILCL